MLRTIIGASLLVVATAVISVRLASRDPQPRPSLDESLAEIDDDLYSYLVEPQLVFVKTRQLLPSSQNRINHRLDEYIEAEFPQWGGGAVLVFELRWVQTVRFGRPRNEAVIIHRSDRAMMEKVRVHAGSRLVLLDSITPNTDDFVAVVSTLALPEELAHAGVRFVGGHLDNISEGNIQYWLVEPLGAAPIFDDVVAAFTSAGWEGSEQTQNGFRLHEMQPFPGGYAGRTLGRITRWAELGRDDFNGVDLTIIASAEGLVFARQRVWD